MHACDFSNLSKEGQEAIITLAKEEGMACLLYQKILEYHDLDRIIDIGSLKSYYYQTIARNELILNSLDSIRDFLHGQGIPMMALKGSELARRIYPYPGLRPMADVDILVEPEDIHNVLQSCKKTKWELDKITYHAVFTGGSNQNLLLEVHWTLPGGYPCPDWFFDEKHQSTAHLTYLLAHLGIHHPGDHRLIWLYDIHLLISQESEQINWKLLKCALKFPGWGKIIMSVLEEVNSLFGIQFPDFDIQKAENEKFHLPGYGEWIFQAFRELSWNMRIRSMIVLVFPSRRYMNWRYKPKFLLIWPVYYIVRWHSFLTMLVNPEQLDLKNTSDKYE